MTYVLPGVNQDQRQDGTFETVTVKKFSIGPAASFSEFTADEITKSVGSVSFKNTDASIAGKSFSISF